MPLYCTCIHTFVTHTHNHLQDAPDGFYRLVEGLIDDIFKFGTLMPRLTKLHQQPDYLAELDEIAELSDMKDEILSRVSSAITQVNSQGCTMFTVISIQLQIHK